MSFDEEVQRSTRGHGGGGITGRGEGSSLRDGGVGRSGDMGLKKGEY